MMNEEILIRYLQNETNEAENCSVESWIEESDDNKEILEQLYFVLEANDTLSILQSVDTDEALDRFKQKVKKKERSASRKHLFLTLQRIASVLFLPALAMSLYLFNITPNETLGHVGMVEMRTNSGMISAFTLPDGSKVWLNSNSCIRYPSAFRGSKRKVEINGQAYFEVVKNAEQPFIVQTKDKYSLEVLGTTFNIAAYDNEDIIETTLISGSVNINLGKNDQQRVLVPSEKAVFTKENSRLDVSSVNSEYDTAWLTGQIKFKNHSMSHVLRLLSRQYNVTFDISNKRVLESKITASFDNEQLPQILEYLRLASGISFRMLPQKSVDEKVAKTVIRVS